MCIPFFACFKSSPVQTEITVRSKENEQEGVFSIEKIENRPLKPEEPSRLQGYEYYYLDFVLKKDQNSYVDEAICNLWHNRICGRGESNPISNASRFVIPLIQAQIKYIRDSFHAAIEGLFIEKTIKSTIQAIFVIKRDIVQSYSKMKTVEKIRSCADLCTNEYFRSTIEEFFEVHLENLLNNQFDDPEIDEMRKGLKILFYNDGLFQFRYLRYIPSSITQISFETEISKCNELFHHYIQTNPDIIPSNNDVPGVDSLYIYPYRHS